MVEALGGRGSEPALCVLLFTSANTVGRMVAGVVTERLLHCYGVPRCAPSLTCCHAEPGGRHWIYCCPPRQQAPGASIWHIAVCLQHVLLDLPQGVAARSGERGISAYANCLPLQQHIISVVLDQAWHSL